MKRRRTYFTTIVILAVIVLVHLIVVRWLFFSDTPVATATTQPNAEQSASGTSEVASDIPASASPTTSTVPAAPAIRLDFRYARRNSIPGLPTKEAGTGILWDMNNGYVLWEKNSTRSVPIASMTKMMTVLVAVDEIRRRPDITLETMVTVTRAAERIGGSQVYLRRGEKFSLRELLISMMVKSANDSAYLVAEFLGRGKVSSFIAVMNRRAHEMKLTKTIFFNPNGLPIKHHKSNSSSAEDLVHIAATVLQYPEIMKWAGFYTYSFRPKKSKAHMLLVNTNKLLKQCRGVDGLKTGFTNKAGSCITITCKRNNIRLIAIVTGFRSWRTRNAFMKKLLDWGYKYQQTLPH